MLRRGVISATLSVAIGALSSLAVGQQRPPAPEPRESGGNDRAGYPYPTQQSALDSGVYDLTNVYAQAATARAEERRASSDLNITVIRLKRNFETSPEYKSALQEVNQAHDALDSARKPIFDQVSGDPHYKELSEKREKVSTILSEGNLAPRDVLDLAMRKMMYGSEMRRMESDALNNDSGVQSARNRLVSAQQKVNDLRDKFEGTIYQNPQWAAAKQALENSRVAAAGAEGAQVGAIYTVNQANSADARHSLYGNSYSNGGAILRGPVLLLRPAVLTAAALPRQA